MALYKRICDWHNEEHKQQKKQEKNSCYYKLQTLVLTLSHEKPMKSLREKKCINTLVWELVPTPI